MPINNYDLSTLTFRALKSEETDLISAAMNLLNRSQGNGLFAEDYLTRRISDPNALVLVATLLDQLVGIAVAEEIHEFSYYVPFDPNIQSELEKKKVGSFTTLSVVESWQGKGVGQKLSNLRLSWAREHGCEVIVGVSWMSGLAHTSNRTFEKSGFRAVKQLNDFYIKSSLEKPFDCPGCHSLPCVCGAIFYRLDFKC